MKPVNNKYVTIFAAENPLYISIAKSILADSGIKFKCRSDYLNNINGFNSNYFSTINIKVSQNDALKAKKAIGKQNYKHFPEKNSSKVDKFFIIFSAIIILILIIVSLIIKQ
jgi:hypothetical protein